MSVPAQVGRHPETAPVRVLVVDDSVVVRSLLVRWVNAEPGFEVVGTAGDGRQALDVVDGLRPDIVLLDLEMPEMDGVDALPRLLERRPGLAVIVVSTLTTRNADLALKCLARGALDYMAKPTAHAQLAGSEVFRRELTAKLRGLAADHLRRASPAIRPVVKTPSVPIRSGSRSSASPRAIFVGASTGGPQAVIRVLSGLRRASRHVPILVVQHMPPVFTSVFAEHIRDQTGLSAREAVDEEPLSPGQVYVAPGGRHMGLSVSGGAPVIHLDDGPPVQFCRPALDVLFRDAAAVFGSAALAVVLTGMGQDGTDGARALVRAGGTVVAQDESSSVVWGMPGSLVRNGLARYVLPLDTIAARVDALVGGTAP